MKKYLFPFFKERHRFLLDKWWFRLLLLAYVVGICLLPLYLASYFMESYVNCYSIVTTIYEWGTDIYKQEFAQCQQAIRDVLPLVAAGVLVGTVVIHYLIQFLFFKITIDFVALGTRFKKVD